MSIVTDLRREMGRIQSELANDPKQVRRVQQEAEKKHVEEEIQTFLHQLAGDFLTEDDKLSLQAPVPGQLGFTITYLMPNGWETRKFSVLGAYESPNLEVMAGDDKWEQLPNAMGNWADWADQKTIYSAPMDEHKLRAVLEQHFLTWYRATLHSAIQ